MEPRTDGTYLSNVDSDDARAFLIARELVAQHGGDVGSFLQEKIDMLTASRDFEQLSAWFVIRNAVALTLEADSTRR